MGIVNTEIKQKTILKDVTLTGVGYTQVKM